MNTQEIENNLKAFTGSENYHKLTMFGRVLFTDGLAYLAKEAKAYWLMDVIASDILFAPKLTRPANESGFLSITFKKTDGDRCVVRFEDGNGNHFYEQRIEYTDLDIPELKFFGVLGGAEDGSRYWVIMLPSEY